MHIPEVVSSEFAVQLFAMLPLICTLPEERLTIVFGEETDYEVL